MIRMPKPSAYLNFFGWAYLAYGAIQTCILFLFALMHLRDILDDPRGLSVTLPLYLHLLLLVLTPSLLLIVIGGGLLKRWRWSRVFVMVAPILFILVWVVRPAFAGLYNGALFLSTYFALPGAVLLGILTSIILCTKNGRVAFQRIG